MGLTRAVAPEGLQPSQHDGGHAVGTPPWGRRGGSGNGEGGDTGGKDGTRETPSPKNLTEKAGCTGGCEEE